MAPKATVYKATLQVSDMDRHHYAGYELVLAQHPSETEERLMLRLLAFATRAMVGLARPERDFEEFATVRDLVIEGEGHIEGAFDGELALMPLPLKLRSLPAALGVVTPREALSQTSALVTAASRMH